MLILCVIHVIRFLTLTAIVKKRFLVISGTGKLSGIFILNHSRHAGANKWTSACTSARTVKTVYLQNKKHNNLPFHAVNELIARCEGLQRNTWDVTGRINEISIPGLISYFLEAKRSQCFAFTMNFVGLRRSTESDKFKLALLFVWQRLN